MMGFSELQLLEFERSPLGGTEVASPLSTRQGCLGMWRLPFRRSKNIWFIVRNHEKLQSEYIYIYYIKHYIYDGVRIHHVNWYIMFVHLVHYLFRVTACASIKTGAGAEVLWNLVWCYFVSSARRHQLALANISALEHWWLSAFSSVETSSCI